MKKTRTFLAAAAAIAGLVAFASPAQAVPPQALAQDVDLPADTATTDGFCPFPVHIDYTTNQLDPKVTTNPDGSVVTRFTGWAYATVTNTDTGTMLNFRISGPGTVTNYTSGAFDLNLGGANLLWTTVANSYPGVPQLAYTKGHVQVEVNDAGLTTLYELNGNGGAPTDVCALLAP
jgi:hypothetical protein